MKSILSKFLCVVIAGLLILSLAIGTISITATHNILHKDADVILRSLCEKSAAQINYVFSDIERSVQIIGFNALAEVENPDDLTDEAFLSSYLEKMEKRAVNIALNTAGVVAFYLRLNPALSTPTSGFYFMRDDPGTAAFYLLPNTDLSLHSPDEHQHVGWFYQPQQAGQAVWMAPYHNPTSNRQIISYVMPLYQQDTFLGIAGMDVDFSVLTERVNGITVYSEGHAYLMDSEGTVYNQPLHKEAHTSDHDHLFAQASAPLQNGMLLKTCASYKDIQQGSHHMLANLGVAFFVILIVFILVTIIITHRIVAPLKSLTLAAEQLAQGNTDVSLSCSSKDEIGTLSRVFQQTALKLKENMKSINAKAYLDALTGIRNHTAYNEMVQELDAGLKERSRSVALLVADINYLKETNDHYGHETGNDLIIHITRLLCNTFKHSPVFRIGGDEFVVILEGEDLENYPVLSAQLMKNLENAHLDEERKIPVSLAWGMARFKPARDTSFHDLFARADQRMYEHKQKIKSSVRFFSSPL